MNTSVSTGATEVASADTYDVQPRQVVYVPKSKGFSTQTLIPFNMASARPAGAGAILSNSTAISMPTWPPD